MIGRIKTLDDFEFTGKCVLLRVDINCPVDENKRIKDDTRIRRSIPTIKELVEKGARLVILAHQADPLDYQNFITLKEHSQILTRLLGKKVEYIEDVAGPYALSRIKELEEGEILLLENIRILTEETIVFEKEVKLPPEKQKDTFLVRKLSPLGDIYICDAFAAAHRSEPSLVAFPLLLPSGCGRLFEEELRALTRVRDNPEHPCIFILGGAKILDAFRMMERVLDNGTADKILTQGLVGQIMLLASGYRLGEPTEEYIRKKNLDEFIPQAEKILKNFPERVFYPRDVATVEKGKRQEYSLTSLPAKGVVVDIGEDTIALYKEEIQNAATIFLNGPAGVYEEEISSKGTRKIWEAVAHSSAFSVIGGGDTISAARKFGLEDKFSYVSTAGGGLVRFISGEKLPVIEALSG